VKIRVTETFKRHYKKLRSAQKQRQVDKALELMADNPQHPSLQFRRVKSWPGLCEARASDSLRIIFRWEKDVIDLLMVGEHDILP